MVGDNIWLDYDQAALDDQYNQRVLVPDANDYMARHLVLSEAVCNRLDCRLDVSYGPGDDQKLDIFPVPGATNTPVVVYFHGGAWTRWDKANNSYQAPAFIDAGAAFVSVNFSLAPKVDLEELIRQCRAAVAWVHGHADEFGADTGQLYVAGHSSGGHVAGLMAVTDWTEWGLPADAIKGVAAASGMYELTPVRLSSRNEYLNLDAAAVARLSAIGQILDTMPAMVIAYGGGEAVEFRRQSADFAAELMRRGHSCRELDLPGLHHFEVAELFADADGPLLRAMFEMMGMENVSHPSTSSG